MILLTPFEEVLLSYFCGCAEVGEAFNVRAKHAVRDLKDIGVISIFRFYQIRKALVEKGAVRELGNMLFAVAARPEQCKTIFDYARMPKGQIWRIYSDNQSKGKTRNLITLRSGSL